MHYASCPDVAPKLEREPLRGPEMDLAAAGGVKRSVDADDLESAAVKFQKTEDGCANTLIPQTCVVPLLSLATVILGAASLRSSVNARMLSQPSDLWLPRW